MSNNDNNAGDNTGMSREKLEKELGKFGEAFGKGQNSRPAAALMCVDAASRCKNVGPNDAEHLYEKFAKAVAKAQGIEYAASSSAKVQVSKLKRFLMLGALPAIDGVQVMNDGTDLIQELARRAENPLRGSAYDNMVLLARRQIEQPTKQLTKDEMNDILTQQPDPKTELDLVIEQYKKTHTLATKLAEAGLDNDSVNNAVEHLGQQIQDMGGELPAMDKKSKAIEKAKKTLAAAGVTVTAFDATDAVEPNTPVLQTVAEAPLQQSA